MGPRAWRDLVVWGLVIGAVVVPSLAPAEAAAPPAAVTISSVSVTPASLSQDGTAQVVISVTLNSTAPSPLPVLVEIDVLDPFGASATGPLPTTATVRPGQPQTVSMTYGPGFPTADGGTYTVNVVVQDLATGQVYASETPAGTFQVVASPTATPPATVVPTPVPTASPSATPRPARPPRTVVPLVVHVLQGTVRRGHTDVIQIQAGSTARISATVTTSAGRPLPHTAVVLSGRHGRWQARIRLWAHLHPGTERVTITATQGRRSRRVGVLFRVIS